MFVPDKFQIINKGGWRDLNTGDRNGDSARTLETIDYAIHALEELRYLSTVRGAGLQKSPVLYL